MDTVPLSCKSHRLPQHLHNDLTAHPLSSCCDDRDLTALLHCHGIRMASTWHSKIRMLTYRVCFEHVQNECHLLAFWALARHLLALPLCFYGVGCVSTVLTTSVLVIFLEVCDSPVRTLPWSEEAFIGDGIQNYWYM